ncbi:MAG: SdpA family antimicrobial peptide system protein [Flavobacteriales bacterium]|nr:SdpA family antimicrobial peptide system protein [Flavobacteriales bacterium]
MNYKNKLFVPFVLLIVLWTFCIQVLLVSFAPYNPLTPSKKFKVDVSLLAPQGWAFFTRNAREPNLYIYMKDKSNKIKVVDFQKNTSSSNLFGISRSARTLSVEIGEILKQVDTSSWSKSSKISIEQQYKQSKAIEVTNKMVNPELKDTIFLEYREKTPWAWIKSYDEIKMPSKTIKLYVKLPKK